jgi:hypothetical protein
MKFSVCLQIFAVFFQADDLLGRGDLLGFEDLACSSGQFVTHEHTVI